MSVPIIYCTLVAAADDPEVFSRVHPVMKRNIDQGHYTVFPRNHEPPCREFTGEAAEALFERFQEPLLDLEKDHD